MPSQLAGDLAVPSAAGAAAPRVGRPPLTLGELRPEFHPSVAKELSAGYRGRWLEILSCLTLPAALGVRANTRRISRAKLGAELARRGVDVRPCAELSDVLVAQPLPASDLSVDATPEVVVGRLCGEAVLKGAHIFVPGVLSCSRGIAEGTEVLITSDVDDMDIAGTSIKQLKGRRVLIGRGVARLSRKTILSRLVDGVAVEVTERVAEAPPAVNGLLPHGLAYFQGLAPAGIAHLLDPGVHRSVVDLCAAPGGKTSHVAARLFEHGGATQESVVVACDRSKRRLSQVEDLATAWGQESFVRCVPGDSAKLPAENGVTPGEVLAGGVEPAVLRSRGLRCGAWDAVLVDPTCSALGLRPRLSHARCTLEEVHRLAEGQRRMLRAATSLVRPGGLIIYSTCTITPQENEQNVAWALANLDLRLRDARPALGGPAWAGHGLQEGDLDLCGRADPAGDLAGFFAAVLMKPDKTVKTWT